MAVTYITFQFYKLYETKYKFNCSIESFCLTQQDLIPRIPLQYYTDNIVLTENEESLLIKSYSQLEKTIETKSDCAIGVGYQTCMDVNFRAVDLFMVLEDDIKDMMHLGKITPQVHDRITELREFVETFLYYFSQGANAERVCDSKKLFQFFIDNINSKVQHVDYLGGHSAVFALRAQKEKCKAFISVQPTDFNQATLPLNEERAQKYLLWPQQSQKVSESQKKELMQNSDIHLVFEYNEGDTILGFTAPRSNRFYFVDDPSGAYFKEMENYHHKIKEHPEIQRHMLAGYQLMQKLPIKEAEERLQKLETLWLEMKSQKDTDHRIHTEFAHFSRLDFFRIFEHYVVRNSDSLGMNEQELIMLLDFWDNKLHDINQAHESKPSLDEVLEQLKRFFEYVKANGLSISRVHMHPYGSFILCYDHQKWEDGRDAIIKSSLTTPKYCMMADDLGEHIDNYDIPERPMQLANPQNFGDIIKIDRQNLTYSFNLDDNIHCYLQFFMKCRQMVKTAGMGDTISSTGFIYQPPKRK